MNFFSRRQVAVIAALAVASVVTLTGCSAGSTGTTSANDTLTVGDLTTPASLDFTKSAGAAIPQAELYNVYEGLVKVDEAGDIKPLLASSYTVSDGGRVYDFKLHDNVTFSNGAKFDAETVKFSLGRVKDNWTANSPEFLDPIESVTATSQYEVKITLKAPSNGWLFNMAGPVGTMFAPNGVSDLATKPVGTGPYTVTSFSQGSHLTLQRRNDYWGKEPFMKQVNFKYFTDATTESNALLGGDIDMITQFSAFQIANQFKSNTSYQLINGSSTGETTLVMNNQSEAFKDKRVRQAVMYAVDRKAVLDTVNRGYGLVIGAMVPPTDPWYDKSLTDLYPYSPSKAKQLLKEAGVTNLTVSFTVPNSATWPAAAQVIKSQLAAVGITANITPQEFPAVWLDSTFTQHKYDLSIITHAEPRDASNFAAKTYYPGYDNPEVTSLFSQADAATSQSEYVSLMKKATKQMAVDAASDWLYEEPNLTVAKADLKGIPKNAPTLSLDFTTISR